MRLYYAILLLLITVLSGEEPMSWKNNPELKGRTLERYPNDIQVIVHEGHPRLSGVIPESIWITITNYNNGVYSGKLLNKPTNLKSHNVGQEISFIVPTDLKQPAIKVTMEYLDEIKKWNIHKCDKCGNSHLLESPNEFISKRFPNQPVDAVVDSFTYICFICGGVMVVEKK